MIDGLLLAYRDNIDKRLDLLIPENREGYKAVVDAARYSLFAGGKRIRPVILLEFYKLFGGEDDCAYNFACALEMIHTYSLIHDDLPCMDDDDIRRGRPSCHKAFGEDIALLAGDALLTESFKVAANTLGIDPERIQTALCYMAANAGIAGMIGGQILDIDGSKEINEETLIKTYRLKTGALLKTAAVCGSILAGADENGQKLAEEYADNLGLAFQIIDDILDTVADEEKLGKPVGSDQRNNKKTLVSFYGIERCRALARDLTDRALSVLDKTNKNAEALKELTLYLLDREY